jgi:hypothetical protein
MQSARNAFASIASLVGLDRIIQAIDVRRIGAGNTRYPRPGWPVATDRRMATKRRNAQRNRRAHRA